MSLDFFLFEFKEDAEEEDNVDSTDVFWMEDRLVRIVLFNVSDCDCFSFRCIRMSFMLRGFGKVPMLLLLDRLISERSA